MHRAAATQTHTSQKKKGIEEQGNPLRDRLRGHHGLQLRTSVRYGVAVGPLCLLALSWAGWHGIVPSTEACQQDCFVAFFFFFPPKPTKKNPFQVSRDAPVLRDEEESPRSAWRGFNEGWWQRTRGWLWLQEGEGKWSVLYGAGPGAPGLRDPSSAPVGSRTEIHKSESKSCFFCDKSEVRAGEERAPLPGSPQPSHKARHGAGDGPRDQGREKSKLQHGTRAWLTLKPGEEEEEEGSCRG